MFYDSRNAIIVVLYNMIALLARWLVQFKPIAKTVNSEGAIVWQASHEKLQGFLGGFNAALTPHTSTTIDKKHEVEL